MQESHPCLPLSPLAAWPPRPSSPLPVLWGCQSLPPLGHSLELDIPASATAGFKYPAKAAAWPLLSASERLCCLATPGRRESVRGGGGGGGLLCLSLWNLVFLFSLLICQRARPGLLPLLPPPPPGSPCGKAGRILATDGGVSVVGLLPLRVVASDAATV